VITAAVAHELARTDLDDRFELLIGIFIDRLVGRVGQLAHQQLKGVPGEWHLYVVAAA
jgi:hypothetical protein